MFPFSIHRSFTLPHEVSGADAAQQVRRGVAKTFHSTLDPTTHEIHFTRPPWFSILIPPYLLGRGRIRITPGGQQTGVEYTVSFLPFLIGYGLGAAAIALSMLSSWRQEGEAPFICFPATLMGFVFAVNYLVYVIDFHRFVKRTVERALREQVQR
jgi:hypothetical protein